jgi:hypothetical protein
MDPASSVVKPARMMAAESEPFGTFVGMSEINPATTHRAMDQYPDQRHFVRHL